MKCNIGAESETDYGLYFQWGAIEGYDCDTAKDHSSWDTCPWGETTPPVTSLDDEHDAVVAKYGSDYCMPTKDQVDELIANTTATWESDFNGSGVSGMKFIAANGKYIFVPACGYVTEGNVSGRGSTGFVWASSLDTGYTNSAYDLFIVNGHAGASSCYRYSAMPVRGVKKA